MAIKTIKTESIRVIWEQDDISVLPSTYNFQVRDVLFDLDAAATINDLADIGAIQFNPEHEECWSVTITVNNVEPCGAVLCDFWQGDCYNVELKEYNP
jgi:hypothetical protein